MNALQALGMIKTGKLARFWQSSRRCHRQIENSSYVGFSTIKIVHKTMMKIHIVWNGRIERTEKRFFFLNQQTEWINKTMNFVDTHTKCRSTLARVSLQPNFRFSWKEKNPTNFSIQRRNELRTNFSVLAINFLLLRLRSLQSIHFIFISFARIAFAICMLASHFGFSPFLFGQWLFSC